MNTTHKIMDIKVNGMSCSSCVAHVEKALKKIDGVLDVKVDLGKKSAQISLKDNRLEFETVQKILENMGYEALKG